MVQYNMKTTYQTMKPECTPMNDAAQVQDLDILSEHSDELDQVSANNHQSEGHDLARNEDHPGLHNKYILMHQLGIGAFSVVFSAFDIVKNRNVAIKITDKRRLTGQQASHILKEVSIMRRLNHPNVVPLLDFIDYEHHFYLVLELLEGGELFERIVNYVFFSEDTARKVIIQVAEAIKYLHEEVGVVHRDIKPENILLAVSAERLHPATPRSGEMPKFEGIDMDLGPIKIADFGLSKIIGTGDTMTPCGTVGYTAPEIVTGLRKYNKAVDMWALGCVLYTMLCGFSPFHDEDGKVLQHKVMHGDYTFMSPWWDDISEEAKDLIRHLLEVNHLKRYNIHHFFEHRWIKKYYRAPKSALQNHHYFAAASAHTGLTRTSSGRSPLTPITRDLFTQCNSAARKMDRNLSSQVITGNANVKLSSNMDQAADFSIPKNLLWGKLKGEKKNSFHRLGILTNDGFTASGQPSSITNSTSAKTNGNESSKSVMPNGQHMTKTLSGMLNEAMSTSLPRANQNGFANHDRHESPLTNKFHGNVQQKVGVKASHPLAQSSVVARAPSESSNDDSDVSRSHDESQPEDGGEDHFNLNGLTHGLHHLNLNQKKSKLSSEIISDPAQQKSASMFSKLPATKMDQTISQQQAQGLNEYKLFNQKLSQNGIRKSRSNLENLLNDSRSASSDSDDFESTILSSTINQIEGTSNGPEKSAEIYNNNSNVAGSDEDDHDTIENKLYGCNSIFKLDLAGASLLRKRAGEQPLVLVD